MSDPKPYICARCGKTVATLSLDAHDPLGKVDKMLTVAAWRHCA